MKRALILLALLSASLSTAFLLPDFRLTESAIRLDVPERLAGWSTVTQEASKKERDILAKDTRFSKAICQRPRWSSTALLGGGPIDRADLSIVLSGHDLANSIHRPERCMPAQGHKIYHSEKSTIETAGGRQIPARRLISTQELQIGESKDDIIQLDALTYYFFVGHDQLTEDHTRRTLLDIKDRLLKGQAQRWAYVSLTMWFDGDTTPDGSGLSELATADEALRELLGKLADENIDWARIDG